MTTDVKAVISRRLEQIEAEEQELKVKKEMLDDVVANDPELTVLHDKAAEASRTYKLAKEALLNEPENRKLLLDLKDIQQSKKEIKELLSADLLGYYTEENSLQLETADGKLYRISFAGKVKRTKQEEMDFEEQDID